MPTQATDRSVTAVDRTLRILNAFIVHEGICSLTDIEGETGLFKSVICRYMLSFEKQGYIKKRLDGRYQLSVQSSRLGKAFEQGFDLASHVMPVLRELVETTQESASFYVLDGDKRLCLHRIDSPSSLRVAVQPGSLLPIDNSATGQVFMHCMAQRLHAGDTADAASLLRASSNHTGVDHTASVSMPVFGVDHHFVGALTLSGPASRFDVAAAKNAGAALLQAAARLGVALGDE